jgi:putative salt-induced outer membrane protein
MSERSNRGAWHSVLKQRHARCTVERRFGGETMPSFGRCLVLVAVAAALLPTRSAFSQPAADPPPPPLWDVQVGASFVGTNGNTDTSATGADFAANRRGKVWKIESTASVIHTSSNEETTAERYLAMLRGQRVLTPRIGFTTGVKLEKDRFAGLDLRSILDAGLNWGLVRRPQWTLDGLSSIAWQHESRIEPPNVDSPVGVLQLLSKIPFGASGDTTQRFTYYPDFKTAAAYRTEAEITAQAAMNSHLALKFGYLLRYSNDPVPGFKKTDNTTTASIVLRWKAATNAP